MKKHLLIGLLTALLLSLCVSASAAEVTGDTDWTALSKTGAFSLNGVYYISDAEELRLFRDMINDHPNDGAVYSCTFYLTADIELNAPGIFLYSNKGHIRSVADGAAADNWVPIGSDYGRPFKGTFDGQGHTVSGLYSSTREGYAGLFGCLTGAAVRNVRVANAYVYARSGSAGGIAAAATNYSEITDCSFAGFLYAGGTGGAANSGGGIVGNLQSSVVDGCSADASIAAHYAGGIAGIVKNYNARVENCFSAGQVSALNKNIPAGGIAASLQPPAAVRNCGSTVDINATFGAGICGLSGASGGNCTVENCWFAGRFIGDVVANPTLAGITVIAEGYESYVSVRSCYVYDGSDNKIFRSQSARQPVENGENGGGMFSLDAGRASVRTTTASGGTGYWETDGSGNATRFCTVEDTPYALSGRTELTSALNAWAAHHGGTYRMWTADERGLPRFLTGSWSAAADPETDFSGDTVYISTPAELAQLALAVMNGQSFAGKTVVLTNAIDLRGRSWTPIGTASNPFDGTFDGAGHTVSGLVICGGSDDSGLFGSVIGTLRNIRLADASVRGGTNTGGIVGRTTGLIDSCAFSGAVYGAANVGGIAGLTSAPVLNSRSDGIVGATGTAGAIVGSSSGTVGNCFNSGAVYAPGTVGYTSAPFGTSPGLLSIPVFDLSACQGAIAGSGTVHNSYDAGAVAPEDAPALLAALAAQAEATPEYTGWTLAPTANEGLPYFAAFSGGTGTAIDPLRITTAEQLSYLGTLVVSGADQAGVCYRLEADLTFNDGYFDAEGNWYGGNGEVRSTRQPLVWMPIGSAERPFAGNFDGAGHTLSGLYCPGEGGLFAALTGSVSNLLLTDGYFGGSGSAIAGIGGGSIVNCGSTCTGSGSSLSGTNCWDGTAIPTADDLNRWVEAQGSAYARWYAAPDKAEPSFTPTCIPIIYLLNGGLLPEAPAFFHYGEPLPVPAAPTRAGYIFAGWSLYLGESADVPPAAMFLNGGSADTAEAAAVRLEALWAEAGKSLLDYCTPVDGMYFLQEDVILVGTTVITDDTVLDLNGHSLLGSSPTSLLTVIGCHLEIRSSGQSALMGTDTALCSGTAGSLLLHGGDPAAQQLTVGGDTGGTLTVWSPLPGGAGSAWMAAYNSDGQMLSITFIGSSVSRAVIPLTAAQLGAAPIIRGFLLPSAWVFPAP